MRDVDVMGGPSARRDVSPRVGIVGAGVSGICMAARLLRAGHTDITLFETADEVGGTWRDNTYPGLACDVPSRFYQLSFAPRPDWSHLFSPGGEIQSYLQQVARDLQVREHIRFGTQIVRAEWDGMRWRLETAAGDEDVVDVLITATGTHRIPKYPNIPGLDDFAGACFHSARWDHRVELRGKRVGVVGNGSSGVQITAALPDVVQELKVFVRSPQWVVRVPNPAYGPLGARLLRLIPSLNAVLYRLYRWAVESAATSVVRPGLQRRLMTRRCHRDLAKVKDPELRELLTPTDAPLCRRLVLSGGYHDAVQRDNVHVIRGGIDHADERGVVTDDGNHHDLDVLVLATGFDMHAFTRPMSIIGKDGLDLDRVWGRAPRAHRTVAMPGFPNLFMLMGPRSPVASGNLMQAAESQAGYILQAVDFIAGQRVVSPRQDAADAYNTTLDQSVHDTTWLSGCASWYLDESGLPNAWPLHPSEHRRMLQTFDPSEYEVAVRGALAGQQ